MTRKSSPRNIYIVGAQCTGKTTLVKAFENYFCNYEASSQDEHETCRPQIIMEVARTVLQQHGFTADDIKSSPTRSLDLQRLILQAQLEAERSALKHGEWFLSDRSGIDPIVYAQKYVSEDAASDLLKSMEWQELGDRMRKSDVIVCEAGVEWLTDDGVRLMPENREDWMGFHRAFCQYLEDQQISYTVLPRSLTAIDERIAFVLQRWKTD